MHLEASFVRGDLPSALVETGLGLQKSESLGALPTGSRKPMFLEASDTPPIWHSRTTSRLSAQTGG